MEKFSNSFSLIVIVLLCRMALNGPAYLGLLTERTAAIECIAAIAAEATAPDNNWSLAFCDVQLGILEGYWTRFQSAQHQLMLEFPHVDAITEGYSAAEQTGALAYATVKAGIVELKAARQATIQPPPKVPKVGDIRLSTFSGQYTDWTAWQSEFRAKVLDTQLDAADKISLLLSALTAEAANCAGRAERLDALELERIWAKLEKTYDNKYQQVFVVSFSLGQTSAE